MNNMNTATYKVLMKSGRRFLVEELGNNAIQWNGNHTGQSVKTALVKEVVTINKTDALSSKENGFKNSCFVAAATSAIEYINTLDALGLERMESDTVRYLDC
jgi:hypothetical protein